MASPGPSMLASDLINRNLLPLCISSVAELMDEMGRQAVCETAKGMIRLVGHWPLVRLVFCDDNATGIEMNVKSFVGTAQD